MIHNGHIITVRISILAHLISRPEKEKLAVGGYKYHLYSSSFKAFDKNSISTKLVFLSLSGGQEQQ